VVMGRQIAVIAGTVMQQRHLARLANSAEGLERAMNRRKRNMWILPAHRVEYLIGARMAGRAHQRLDDRHPLRRHRETAGTAARRKMIQSLPRVGCVPVVAHRPQSHNQMIIIII